MLTTISPSRSIRANYWLGCAPCCDAPVARRQNSLNGTSRTLEFGGWHLDVTGRQLFSPAGALVPLRAAEFDLLLALAERPQRVLNRDQLLDLARGRAASSFDRSVDVQISRLRRKLDSDGPEFIKTVRGGGYVFAASVTVVGAEVSHAP